MENAIGSAKKCKNTFKILIYYYYNCGIYLTEAFSRPKIKLCNLQSL